MLLGERFFADAPVCLNIVLPDNSGYDDCYTFSLMQWLDFVDAVGR